MSYNLGRAEALLTDAIASVDKEMKMLWDSGHGLSPEIVQARARLEEAKMWLGKTASPTAPHSRSQVSREQRS